jgi:hypothetical protein
LVKTISVKASRIERECEKFTAEPADISRFVAALRKKGVVR